MSDELRQIIARNISDRDMVPDFLDGRDILIPASDALKAVADFRATGFPTAISEIAAERARQIASEGWTPEHDDSHSGGEMAQAAACYVMGSSTLDATVHGASGASISVRQSMWPLGWDYSWWKPRGRRRNLIKAAALIVAEIERLDRANSATSNG